MLQHLEEAVVQSKIRTMEPRKSGLVLIQGQETARQTVILMFDRGFDLRHYSDNGFLKIRGVGGHCMWARDVDWVAIVGRSMKRQETTQTHAMFSVTQKVLKVYMASAPPLPLPRAM